jgi:hypothetical protein
MRGRDHPICLVSSSEVNCTITHGFLIGVVVCLEFGQTYWVSQKLHTKQDGSCAKMHSASISHNCTSVGHTANAPPISPRVSSGAACNPHSFFVHGSRVRLTLGIRSASDSFLRSYRRPDSFVANPTCASLRVITPNSEQQERMLVEQLAENVR